MINVTVGKSAQNFYGSFYDTTIQPIASTASSYAMAFNTTDISKGVVIQDNSKIKILNSGIYNIQFSAQLDRTNSGTDTVDIWLSKNGNNIPQTNTKVTITGGASTANYVAAWNFLVSATSNDYYEIRWSATDTHCRIVSSASAANPIRPAIPSVIMTVTQV